MLGVAPMYMYVCVHCACLFDYIRIHIFMCVHISLFFGVTIKFFVANSMKV